MTKYCSMFDAILSFFHTYGFQITAALEMGFIYGVVALGVLITFRFLDFPDLTADGSFPMGASITALLLTQGFDPLGAMALSFLGGACAGLFTAWLHRRWGILNLLAGILTMTGLYSINLRIMGRPNMSLMEGETLFSWFPALSYWQVLFLVASALGGLFWCFIHSEWGLALRAVGINKKMAEAQGVSVTNMTFLGLGLSNGFIALGGSLFAQHAGFSDISLGIGTIVFGLAAVILGDVFFPRKKIFWMIVSCFFGAILYRFAVAGALNMTALGMQPSDLNLITAGMVIGALMVRHRRKRGSS